jgi:hypothetical protein
MHEQFDLKENSLLYGIRRKPESIFNCMQELKRLMNQIISNLQKKVLTVKSLRYWNTINQKMIQASTSHLINWTNL